MPGLLVLLLCTVWACTAQTIDPQYAETLTVYHFHQPSATHAPTNQNTADFGGSLSFDIYSIFVQFVCTFLSIPELCSNQEIMVPAHRLVLTELQLEVDRRFGDYAMCNVCVNGQDLFDNSTCPDGEYRCHCSPWSTLAPGFAPRAGTAPDERHCKSGVGREDQTALGRFIKNCSGVPHFLCWSATLSRKLAGFWYSTPAETECTAGGPPNCSWRLLRPVQQISKACQEATVLTAVEASNRPCFRECPGRNLTSPCWMSCFVETVLGRDASTTGVPGGLPASALMDIWRLPLRDPAEGGCPRLPLLGFPTHSKQWDVAQD
eukprot:EG_transcript_14063